MPPEVVIDVADLTMRYGDTDVLGGVTFQARRGEVLALLGPNGAGKTTTIEILEGFRARSGGHVEVLGADPATAGEDWRARVGVVLQSWRDHGKWLVGEVLAQLAAYYPDPWDPAELMTPPQPSPGRAPETPALRRAARLPCLCSNCRPTIRCPSPSRPSPVSC
jgi:ABC-type multidrug transport system ATPase subunit